MKRIITLLSDFGTRDHYVAAVKGVLLSINPNLTLVDITHEITAQNLQQAGFVLASTFNFFPEGTLHLAVVDPGVGGKRRGLAAASERYIFIGPDNGLFDRAFALDPPRLVVSIENTEYQLPQPSATFHGRDIFAPAAGQLSLGLPLEKLGPTVKYKMRSHGRIILSGQKELKGEIIHVDRFGNLISNIEIPSFARRSLLRDLRVYLAAQLVLTGPKTYEEGPISSPFALVGSSGNLEVAVRNDSAHKSTGHGVGTPVMVRRKR